MEKISKESILATLPTIVVASLACMLLANVIGYNISFMGVLFIAIIYRLFEWLLGSVVEVAVRRYIFKE